MESNEKRQVACIIILSVPTTQYTYPRLALPARPKLLQKIETPSPHPAPKNGRFTFPPHKRPRPSDRRNLKHVVPGTGRKGSMFGRVFHESRSREFGCAANERGRMGLRAILWLGTLAAAARWCWPRRMLGWAGFAGVLRWERWFLCCYFHALPVLECCGDRRHGVIL